MPITNQYLEANFGTGFTGLAGTVGYQLRDATGGAVGARVTAGIFETDAGSGVYGVVVASVADNVATIVWDTGGGSPVWASEDLDPYHDRNAILADTAVMEPLVSTNLDATVSSRAVPGDAMDLVANAVDAAAVATDAIDADALAADAVAEISDGVWDEDVVAAHGTGDTAGLLLRALGALISQRANTPTLEGLLGVADSAGVDLPEQVNTELETTQGHGAGSWTGSAAVPAIADAVWDESLADHLASGSTGSALLQAKGSEALHVRLSVDPGHAVPLSVDPGFHVELGDE
jgi:hypothetical protein